MTVKKGLGRGLSDLGLHELLSDFSTVQVESEEAEVAASVSDQSTMRVLASDILVPGAYQPRQVIDDETLSELAESIRSHGLLQPILVREKGDQYEIIAGERRWRAAQLAGLESVPVVVRDLSEQDTMAVSLIENIQREDLTVIEEACAYDRLMNECGLTHQEVADWVGKSRATVSNAIRLLKLPADVQVLLGDDQLSMGHARTLLSLPVDQQTAVAREVVERDLSVRQTEEFVRRLEKMHDDAVAEVSRVSFSDIEDRLGGVLGASVQINQNKRGAGRITLHYKNEHHFEHLVEQLNKITT